MIMSTKGLSRRAFGRGFIAVAGTAVLPTPMLGAGR